MAMIPHERSLVQRLKGKPFALLGINTDETRAECKQTMQEKGITWPSWYDGDGKISEQYRVEGEPTLVLIDAKGYIRKVKVGSQDEDKFNKIVEQLVEETEKGAPAS